MIKNIVMISLVAVAISTAGVFSLLPNNDSTSTIHGEGIKALGHVEYKVFGPDGKLKGYAQSDNLVVTNGDNATVDKMFSVLRTTTSATINPFIAVAVGNGVTAPATTNIALVSQQGHKIIGTTDVSASAIGQVKLTAIFLPGKITNATTPTITESGLFDNTASTLNSNSTNMFARQTFGGIVIASSDTLQVTWTVSFN